MSEDSKLQDARSMKHGGSIEKAKDGEKVGLWKVRVHKELRRRSKTMKSLGPGPLEESGRATDK